MLGRNMLISKIAFILALLVVDIVSAKLTAADLSKSLAKLRSYSLQQTRGIRTNPEDTANLKKQLPVCLALLTLTHIVKQISLHVFSAYMLCTRKHIRCSARILKDMVNILEKNRVIYVIISST